jgi:hypothetical protein
LFTPKRAAASFRAAPNVVAVALANRNARTVWAVLADEVQYRAL